MRVRFSRDYILFHSFYVNFVVEMDDILLLISHGVYNYMNVDVGDLFLVLEHV